MYITEHGYGGGYGGAGTPPMADNAWSSCCNFGSSYTPMGQLPRAWRKELFVNVFVLNVDYENPITHVSNWVGSLVRSQHVQGHVRAGEIMPDIVGMIKNAVVYHGWNSDVQPVMLPPADHDRHAQYAPFRRMGHSPSDELPMLMCFRVSLLSQSAHGNQFGNGLLSCCTGCELNPISATQYDYIGMQVQDGLRRLRHAVNAQIECTDAPGAANSLMNKYGILQGASVISQSRGQSAYGGGSYGGGYGGGYDGGVQNIYGGGIGSPGTSSGYGSPSRSGISGYGGGYGGPSDINGYGGGYGSPNHSGDGYGIADRYGGY